MSRLHAKFSHVKASCPVWCKRAFMQRHFKPSSVRKDLPASPCGTSLRVFLNKFPRNMFTSRQDVANYQFLSKVSNHVCLMLFWWRVNHYCEVSMHGVHKCAAIADRQSGIQLKASKNKEKMYRALCAF